MGHMAITGMHQLHQLRFSLADVSEDPRSMRLVLGCKTQSWWLSQDIAWFLYSECHEHQAEILPETGSSSLVDCIPISDLRVKGSSTLKELIPAKKELRSSLQVYPGGRLPMRQDLNRRQ